VDVDLFVAAHRTEWDRLAHLVRRGGGLRGSEADELVRLYQRVATHLSIVRTEAPDPALVARLSTLVTRARSVITGTHNPAWREVRQFFARKLPAALYLGWRWWVPAAALFLAVSGLLAVWVATSPDVRASIAAPAEIETLTRPGGEFETYYSSNPAGSFAAQVWTNNAWITAGCLMLGVLLGIPVVYLLWMNAVNLGVSGGLMAAVGIGIRLGWTVVDPRGRTRSQALAEEGRSVVAVALGLACVLAVSGVIEAFVTPSGLPTWARVGIGVLAELAFLLYVFVIGRRAVAAGETGDIDARQAGDTLPASG
jgi:uncharacterized membrane protein SpoIIM required for sporulation